MPTLVGTIPAEYCKDAWLPLHKRTHTPVLLEKRGGTVGSIMGCVSHSSFGKENANQKLDYHVLYPGKSGGDSEWFGITNELVPEGNSGRSRAVKCSLYTHSDPQRQICVLDRLRFKLGDSTVSNSHTIAPAVHDAWQCSVLVPLVDGELKPRDVTCIEMDLVEGEGDAITTHMTNAAAGGAAGDALLATALRLARETVGLMADSIERGVYKVWPTKKAPRVGEVAANGGETATRAVLLDWELSDMCNTTMPGFMRHFALASVVSSWISSARTAKEMEPLLTDLQAQLTRIVEGDSVVAHRAGWPVLETLSVDESVHSGVLAVLQQRMDERMGNVRANPNAAARIMLLFENVLPLYGVVMHTFDSAEIRINMPAESSDNQNPVVKSWRMNGRGYVWAKNTTEAAAKLKAINTSECEYPEGAMHNGLSAFGAYQREQARKQKGVYQVKTIEETDGSQTHILTYNKQQ
eukprot:GDKI01010076.1.p1 GENE.GDKI01010076.1~~GDKI01010076.1.p1  ORF type:complete len:538 (-),score=130.06 GDKI01010076.1:49-1446(-)